LQKLSYFYSLNRRIDMDKIKIAVDFINSTHVPIFLTGKAGTGKTTFLRSLGNQTHKSYLIVAPTGIAALHAKGVTIHSQFLLPLGSYLPTREPDGNFGAQIPLFTQHTLTRRNPLNSVRKTVLSSIELLIIDEVSMLRADTLDAIDFRLKHAKNNFNEPFGGVQVLLIGDLFQLPPIVKDNEWQILSKFYKSMHFYDAQILKSSGLVSIELDKIFRQNDEHFIRLLNNLRNNIATPEDIQFLNEKFTSEEQIKSLKDIITITTHNYKAEAQNLKELEALEGKSYEFDAIIEKDFPESLYPLPKTLTLKIGAQVMFIKNDSSGDGNYFNGKMAKIISIEKDEIQVKMADNNLNYVLKREVWKNTRFVLNENTKEIEDDVIGTFQQFPIKLAWAVTVHKSQGLTFEKAIIDVGQAFAPGQVYVALSRLKSLDGLYLRTRISPSNIYCEPDIIDFTKNNHKSEILPNLLSQYQKQYLEKLLQETFDFSKINHSLQVFKGEADSSFEFEDPEMRTAISELIEKINHELGHGIKFQNQLVQLLKQQQNDFLLERLTKGSDYYMVFLKGLLQKIYVHLAEVERFSKTKTYIEELTLIETAIVKKYSHIGKIKWLVSNILLDMPLEDGPNINYEFTNWRKSTVEAAKEATLNNPKFLKSKTGKKKKDGTAVSQKRVKGETYEITFGMSEMGATIEEIAIQRELSISTIQSHLAKGIKEGRISIFEHLKDDQVKKIESLIKKYDADFGLLKQSESEAYDYGLLKMVAAHMRIEPKGKTEK
jgi:hypothetical protein